MKCNLQWSILFGHGLVVQFLVNGMVADRGVRVDRVHAGNYYFIINCIIYFLLFY